MPRVDVYSELSTRELNAVGLAIFKVWTEWAMGQRSLGGRRLRQPTGTYASALRVQMQGKNHVAVFVDTTAAPHAGILETGHRAFSMLDHLTPGRAYPITRTGFVASPTGSRFAVNPSTGRRSRNRGSGLLRAGRFVPSVAAIVRTPAAGTQPYGMNTSGRGPAWTVPAMPAYSPARYLSQMFAQRARQMGGTISFSR